MTCLFEVTIALTVIYFTSREFFHHDDKDSCYLLPESGSCMADMTRYFNKKSGTCEEFSYGGCSGNDNNSV